jgi:hypothetical protein
MLAEDGYHDSCETEPVIVNKFGRSRLRRTKQKNKNRVSRVGWPRFSEPGLAISWAVSTANIHAEEKSLAHKS